MWPKYENDLVEGFKEDPTVLEHKDGIENPRAWMVEAKIGYTQTLGYAIIREYHFVSADGKTEEWKYKLDLTPVIQHGPWVNMEIMYFPARLVEHYASVAKQIIEAMLAVLPPFPPNRLPAPPVVTEVPAEPPIDPYVAQQFDGYYDG